MTTRAKYLRGAVAAVALASAALVGLTGPAEAASSKGCVNGGYTLKNLSTGAVVATAGEDRIRTTIPADQLGDTFGVQGTYTEFKVRSADFAVLDQGFTGAPNELDITGGNRTPVFASKVPDHRGLVLSSGIAVELREERLILSRAGTGVAVKIQAKDCAQGGIFQMEPEREDGTATRITHTLATPDNPGLVPFYFDNPAFRARIGQFLGSGCTSAETGPAGQFCVEVSARVNITNDVSPDFVVRDSAQVATRVPQPACNTADPLTPSAAHCGGISVWDVASGGRMGFVTGEDSTEVANPPTTCVSDCQARNQVQGRLANLGHPYPVPAGSRLTPRIAAVPNP